MASTGEGTALKAFFAFATVGAGLTGMGYLIKPDMALAFNGLPADTNAATCYVSHWPELHGHVHFTIPQVHCAAPYKTLSV